MNSLPLPVYDCDSFAVDMLAHLSLNDQSLGRRVEVTVRGAYSAYVANMNYGEVYQSPVLDEADATHLRRGFELLRTRKKYAGARQALDDSVKTIGRLCPICGIGPASTLDHFAPKDGSIPFPEHSFHIRNLIPMCERCNSHKSSISAPHPRDIRFPNVYYDSILIGQTRLAATVVTDSSHPFIEFSFRYDTGIPPEWVSLVEYTCKRLKLFERWSLLGQEEMAAVADEYTEIASVWTIADIERDLESRARAYRRRFGPNYFRAAIYEAMANAPEFWQGPHLVIAGN